ncbi:hypothetical protein [Polaromonas sp. DSR2-3-2]|uniref:hypothetical protein n=1 Tax=unclassified Polaromonas TaxID=2638319 RepID=UPI003CFB7192
MKSLISISLAALLAASLSGCAQDGMMRQGSMQGGAGMKGGLDMKMMDTNNDAMISKEEFMKHHEAMYDKMKKGSNGMVSVKDMQMMMHDMMMQK